MTATASKAILDILYKKPSIRVTSWVSERIMN